MIASQGGTVLATPGTLTGSIGVIAMIPEVSGLMEKYFVNAETVKTADEADLGSFLRPMEEAEKEKFRRYILDEYDHFIGLVAQGRGLSPEQVNEVAQGRVWTGRQAQERGLVDGMGGLRDAFLLLRQQAGFLSDPRIIQISPGQFGFSVSTTLPELLVPSLALPEDVENLFDFYDRLDHFEEGEALFCADSTALSQSFSC